MLKKNVTALLLCLIAAVPSFSQNVWMDAMKGNNSKLESALAGGTDINAQKPNSGYTLLFFAVAGMQYKTVEMLLGKGAKPDIKNDDGDTPLTYAIIQNKEKLVKLLIEKGANVNVEGRDGFPIAIALSRTKCDYEIIEALYNAGADITIKDDSGHDVNEMMYLRKDKNKIKKLFGTPPTGKK
ncbi:hypothetical protein BH11BAC3_BH11BAC3_20780 [soil metagenome]